MRHLGILQLFAVVLVLLGTSCGGSSSGGSSGSDSAGTAFLIGDGPTDDLSSFVIEVEELKLRQSGGGLTENLLAGPRTLDVLGLGLADREALLGLEEVAPGVYDGIYLKVDSSSLSGRNRDGVEVSVTTLSDEAEVSFQTTKSAPLQVTEQGFASVSVEIVLDQCLTSTGVDSFSFQLSLRAAHGQETLKLDDFTGQVVDVNQSAKWFEVEIIDARYSQSNFGRLRVEVTDEDQLFQFTGAEFGNSNAFLANLKMDDLVEIEGFLTRDGTFDAERCEIEDRHTNQVRIEGRLLSIDTGNQTLELLWEEIEMGYALARPVLIALGDPGVLEIEWDNKTKFLGTRGSSNVGPDDLVPGQKLEVRFDNDDFVAPMPFMAAKIRVDGEQRYEGTVDDISALPSSFSAEIDNDHPAVNSGRITDPVQVNLDDETVIFVDTGVSPWLEADDLLTGMRVKMAGKLTGSGTGANLAATRVEIEPGKLSGFVMSVDPAARRFTAMVEKVDDPFGGTPPSGVTEIVVDTAAVLELNGDAVSFAEFRDHFNSLGSGEQLDLELEGVGQADGTILAFEMDGESD